MESIQVRTADGVRLAATHVTRTGPGDDGLAVVVAHGFTVSLQRPSLQRVMARFARRAGVVGVDFRGHGRSEGATTAGDREVLDLDAAVGLARELGYRRVATVGFSMGGAVVLRHAARASASGGLVPRQPVDAVVAVSAPSRWYIRETRPMRRVHWLLETPAGHWFAARALKVRIGGVWGVPPEWPLKAIPRIEVPLLVVHGDRDRYFGVEHGRALAAARPGTEYWELAGFGHAEGPLTPAQVDRIAAWVVESAGTPGTMRR
ncbi:MAG TPA: alpha/beta fold hydrolase [Mycobacteriales bacterium]|nr:alpha/beta fold hydrolase [Mycobacteriales bacterium]